MTEAEGWRFIGKKFEEYAETGNVDHQWTDCGLCYAADSLYYVLDEGDISDKATERLQFIHNCDDWWFPKDQEHAGLRALYAYLLAELAEEDWDEPQH